MVVTVGSRVAGDFAVDGFVALNGVLGENDLACAEEAIAAWSARQIETWTGKPPLGSDLATEFHVAWQAAGGGEFRRSPFRNLVHPGFYAFLRSPALLAAAAELLETDELSVHGIFNARPMMPGGNTTPWHQDAQYWRVHGGGDAELARDRRILSIWMPLQDLDPMLGGLEVAPLATTKSKLYADNVRDPATDLLTLAPEDERGLCGAVPMVKRGGLIGFTQLSVHRGTPNRSHRVRWSVDVRYEANDGATAFGRRFGFVANSPSGRYPEDSYEQWRDRCLANLPAS
jgi:phytanoyl-CoA hydroxylase